ncbi:MAG: VWA domain-containing protein [Bacteroidia bacterium]|nr:VWA domain-containing protein [Bacteroidia bacterium]
MRLRLVIIISTLLLLSAFKRTGNQEYKQVDLVFCVDLSASTNGILHDIRTGMWTIANKINGKNNTLTRIGVVGYARPSFGATNGYVKIISNLTTDYDKLGYDLYQLKAQIEKGDHFVPNALYETLTKISWSSGPATNRIVYLIGNGSAFTGPLNLVNICEDFTSRKITVHSVYVVASQQDEVNEKGYQTVAEITGGEFFRMKPSQKILWEDNREKAGVYYKMNHAFNSTMLFYTQDANDRKKYTFETDKYVLQNSTGAFMQRLRYKASDQYRHAAESYDLTSYYLKNRTLPQKINLEFLAKNDRVTSLEQIEKSVRQKALARTKLCEEINYVFREAVIEEPATEDSVFKQIILKNIQ